MASVLVAAALAAAACGGGTSSSSPASKASTRGGTLTIASTGPSSLNPSSAANNAPGVYVVLAYASLINWTNANTFTPGLATSWKYVGSNDKTFQLTLRKGVKFSDGEAMTAQAVANSINYFKKSNGGPTGLDYQNITATATGPLQVTLTSTIPDPYFVQLCTPFYLGGAIIAPKGLADPKLLQTQSEGAGEYVLQASQSVANDHYTYTANPNYYDQSAIHYKKVVIQVINEEQSAVAALRTGQIQLYIGGSKVSAGSVASAGGYVLAGPSYWVGLQLLDWQGKVFKPLGNVKVRQALSYALNRTAITNAVFGKYATPTAEPALRSWAGYSTSLSSSFSYNPAKAKQLLAQAGYPGGKGVTVPMVYLGFSWFSELAQAIGQELKAVGINVQYDPVTTIGAMLQAIYSGKVAAYNIPISMTEPYFLYPQNFGPKGNLNGMNEVTPSLQNLYDTAVSSPSSASWTSFLSWLTNNAYTLPTSIADQLYYVANNTNAGINAATGLMDYTEISPKS